MAVSAGKDRDEATEPDPGVAQDGPDLPTQLEAILDQVWRSEADWRLDDLIDLATRRKR
jgi:hypothetical protein